jgi:exodeoxyribonuclease VII large subunit
MQKGQTMTVAGSEVAAPWTVSGLTQALKDTIEGSFPLLSVQGEVSNCKLQASGHLYFTLKDAHAQIHAVMFRTRSNESDSPINNGDLVVVEGNMNVYAAGGRYQINVKRLQKQGLGALLLALEERKKLIAQRGWFRAEHKQKLPFLPRRIGVITSPSGAVIRDIIHVLSRRGSGFHLILNPVKVQGEGAAEEIAAAINFFNEHLPVDVLLVGRGGGSFEDLWCFNAEIVAHAIFHSRIPIICAVGHETDHCIAEYVADVRAPTPSAAAEMIMAEQLQQQRRIQQLQQQLSQSMNYRLDSYRQRLRGFELQPRIQRPLVMLEPYMQRLDEWTYALQQILLHRLQKLRLILENQQRLITARSPQKQLLLMRERLDAYRLSLEQSLQQRLRTSREALNALERTLAAINPRHLLARGYSILFAEKDGSVITNANTIDVGASVRICLAEGYLKATIDQVIPGE